MGKRVFEVAKELGIDHRDLLEKCDVLQIRVRNYMSMLSDDDELLLRNSIEQAEPIVEKVQGPGVVRRRRAPKREATAHRPAPPKGRIGLPGARDEAKKADAAPRPPAPGVKSLPPRPVEAVESAPSEELEVVESAVTESAEAAVEAVEAPTGEAAPAAEQPAEPEQAAVAEQVASDASESSKPDKAVEVPTPNHARLGSPAKARVLGSIPIDQLKARTARPPARKPANRAGGHGPGQNRFSGGAQRGAGQSSTWKKPDGTVNRTPGFDPNAAPGAAVPRTGMDTTRRRRAPGTGPREDDRERGIQQKAGPTGRRRQVFSREDIYQGSSKSNRGRKRKTSSRKGMKTRLTTPAAHKRVVRVNETISVGELGKELGVKAAELIGKLIQMGLMATINQQLDLDTVILLATDYDYEVKNVAFDEEQVLSGPTNEAEEDDPDAELRAPVVTIMGHVDHGKTTLLDRIREANVADGEAGGITQHVGAYKVRVGESEVVFLDTPGHEAFTAMRARGASVTDIVVLIVAADDGVMPQTIESINHAKAAGVPLVVAVNKIDKPGVDPERIKQELTTYELVPEEWGGETIYVPVSALKGDGITELLEALVLQAEILELRANPKADAFGAVVEARVDKGLGTVCTVLVQEGTLKRSDYIVCGSHYGRVRAMLGDGGNPVEEAGPSTPVEVLGLAGMPAAGDSFHVVASERDARRVVSNRSDKARIDARVSQPEALDPMALLEAFGQPDKLMQNIILKSDVSGSYEAIKASLLDLSNDEVELRLLHGGVGSITESDVDLAQASNAVVIGFNTDFDSKAKRAADKSEVTVLQHSVIYETIDAAKALLGGLLTPETVEELIGKVEVRAVFHIQKIGPVAGCFVLDGKVVRNALAKVMRADEEVESGKLTTLKRFKDDVREVGTGYECGISIEGYKGIEEGDVIEVYEVKEIQRSLD